MIAQKTMRAPLSDRDLLDNSPIIEANKIIKNWK
jgi:hypothetical protein